MPTQDSQYLSRETVMELAHELRQPLSAIESMAFYLQMTAGQNNAQLNAQAERIRQMVDSANWLLSDILHVLHNPVLRTTALNPGELVQELLAETWTSADEIAAAIPSDLPALEADEAQLRHLIRGMLHFLRRFAEKRDIRLSVFATPASVVISGAASAPQVDLDVIFRPFAAQQLYACRLIAEAHRGTLTAERDADGWLTLRAELPSLQPLP